MNSAELTWAKRLAAIFLLYAAGLGAAGQFAKLSVPFPALAVAYPDAGLWLGWMVSLISFLGILLGFAAGMLVARWGYRRLLMTAMVGGAVVSALQSLLPSVPVFLGLRLAEGVSHLVIVVAAPTLMVQLSPVTWRPVVMTIWSTFFGVAFAVMAWGGLPLVSASGLGSLILAHGLWMAIVAALLWPVLPRLTAGRPGVPGLSEIWTAHIRAYRSPRRAPPAMGWLCYTLTYVALLTVLPAQLDAADRVWATGLMPLAGLLVSMTIGVLLLRFLPAVILVIAGFGLAAIGAIWLGFDPQNAVLVVALMAVLGLVQSGSFASVPQLNQSAEAQAEANGAMAQMGNLGNTLGTPILLVLVSLGGPAMIYAGLVVAYVAGAGLHLWQARRRVVTA